MSDKIIVLSDREQARKRINVFHGSASNWINMIKELIGNSLDVFSKNELHKIDIKIIDSQTIEYRDSGKGIPIEGIASDGRKNYEAIFEKAFAGSKYNNTGKTVGQNGIFLYTLAMTCKDVVFEVARPNGNVYKISYHKGIRNSDLTTIGRSDETYSRILFTLDDEVWKDINFTYEEICRISQGQAALGNVVIKVADVESSRSNTFYYENGIEEYFNELTVEKDFVTDAIKVSKTIYQEVEDGINDELDINFIMKYSNDSNKDIQKDFLNTADLIQYGTIQDGIITSLRRIIDKWLKSNNKYNKNEKSITKDDVAVGLNYVCTVDSLYVEYDNQVKQKTSASHYRQGMQVLLDEFFNVFQIENKLEFERMCNQVLINKRANDRASSIRKDIKKKLSEKVDGITNKIDDLVDCIEHGLDSELYIAEGKSALGSIVLARDPKFQAAIPIRGKILNCLKADIGAIFKSQIVMDIIKAIGCGVELDKKHKDIAPYDPNNLRYGKIVFATDMDADGYQIICLLLTMIYRLIPSLISDGRVFIAKTPLYEVRLADDSTIYWYSETEKNQEIVKYNNIKNINRAKG